METLSTLEKQKEREGGDGARMKLRIREMNPPIHQGMTDKEVANPAKVSTTPPWACPASHDAPASMLAERERARGVRSYGMGSLPGNCNDISSRISPYSPISPTAPSHTYNHFLTDVHPERPMDHLAHPLSAPVGRVLFIAIRGRLPMEHVSGHDNAPR